MTTGRGLGQDDLTLGEKLRLIPVPFLALIAAVAGVGFLCLYSAGGGSFEPWAGKQIVRFILGLLGVVVAALIDIRVWMRAAYPFYALCILLLIYVDIRGHIGMGAQRWINLGFMQLQPSETMKIATILALARYFHSRTLEEIRRPVALLAPLALIGMPTVLVLAQPDLGTAVTIVLGGAALMFLAGVRYWIFAAAAVTTAALLPLAWHFLYDYQKRRVLVFLNPESDPLGAGYHITQSKIAIGSGGLFGKGFLEGSQSRLNFLPEKQTDFIFTLLSEEWGFAGALALMAAFLLIIGYGYFTALNCQSQFARLLALGVAVNFFIYAFVNMGMVMGLLPVVGVPLPMISYGGTAMLSVLFGFGLLLSARVHRDVKFSRGGLYVA